MRSWALDIRGDLIFPMRYVSDLDELIQLALTRILKIYDEDVFALETGIRWFEVMFNNKATQEQRALEVRDALLSIPEVTEIVRLDIQAPGADQKIAIRFQLNTIYGLTGEVNL